MLWTIILLHFAYQYILKCTIFYFRYIIPYRNTAKTVVLHCQPDHSLCRNLLPFHSGILFALSGKKSH